MNSPYLEQLVEKQLESKQRLVKQWDELPNTFIECDCYNEGIRLVYEDEEQVDIRFLYLSIFTEGYNTSRICWRQRLRHIWYILRYGSPWAD